MSATGRPSTFTLPVTLAHARRRGGWFPRNEPRRTETNPESPTATSRNSPTSGGNENRPSGVILVRNTGSSLRAGGCPELRHLAVDKPQGLTPPDEVHVAFPRRRSVGLLHEAADCLSLGPVHGGRPGLSGPEQTETQQQKTHSNPGYLTGALAVEGCSALAEIFGHGCELQVVLVVVRPEWLTTNVSGIRSESPGDMIKAIPAGRAIPSWAEAAAGHSGRRSL